MGSLYGKGRSNETPQHQVNISKFAIGRFEVTVEEYMACVKDGKCNLPEWQEAGNPRNVNTGNGSHYKMLGTSLRAEEHPIVGVSWKDAKKYTQWLSQKTGKKYRLPSEAEWEYAARSGNQYEYSYGNADFQICVFGNISDLTAKKLEPKWIVADCRDKHGRATAHKTAFIPNSYGIYNMIGNVQEWVEDSYSKSYLGAPSDGSAWVNNPNNKVRVLRGGGWYSHPLDARSAFRSYSVMSYRNNAVGFRIALELEVYN